MAHGSPIPSFAFRTPAQRNRSLVDQMQAESDRQRKMEEEEQKRLQREMQLEIQRQKLREQSEQEDLKSQFQVEQRRQQVLENQDSFLGEFGIEQRRQKALDQQRAPRGTPTATPTPSIDPVEAELRRRAGIQTSPIPAEPTGQPFGFLGEALSGGLSLAGKAGEAFQFATDPAAILGRAAPSPRPSVAGGLSRDQLQRQALLAASAETLAPPSFTELQEEGALVSRPLVGPALEAAATAVEQVERPLGVEGVVSGPLRSQIAEDIATEIFNPINIALAAPFAMQGTAGLTGIRLAEQIASNLLLTGLEPGLVRGTLRGFAALGTRGTVALRTIPEAVQNTPVFQRALLNIQEAGEAGARPLRGGEEVAGVQNLAFHETSPRTAIPILQEGKFGSVGPMGVRFDVATSRELALGQRGKGAKVILDFDALTSRPIQKPGTALAGQQEFSVTNQAGRPVLAVDFDPNALDRVTKRFIDNIRDLDPARIQDLPDGSIRVLAEGRAAAPPLRGGEEGLGQGRKLRGEELPGGSIAETSDEAVIHISKGDPGPPPPDQPPTGGRPPEGPSPDDFNLADVRIGKEEVGETLIRRHQGAVDTAKRIAANEVRDNNKELVRIGLGRHFRQSVVAKEEGAFNELNSLLHNPGAVERGERVVPENLQDIYRQLRSQTDFEQAARIDFDPDQALIEDYFFRGWQPPEGMFTGEARGSLGRNPSFRLPRVDATYDEMFEAGFRPLFENPAEQARYSQVMGVKYREQMKLIDFIKESELAMPVVGGPVPKGWRVPRVGPAFEGKPYADGARTAFTRRWAVPDSLATRLENAYGVTPDFGKGKIFGKEVDFKKALDAVTFTPKRAKLIGSVFQHVDFLTRSGLGAWTGFADAVRRGQPIVAASRLAKWPKSGIDIIRSTFSPNFRARLSKLAVDDTPLWEGRKISNKSISEAGLSLRDETILPELDGVIRDVLAESKIVRLGKAPIRALGDLERFWRQGLFDGVYPAAILSDIKNNIGPMILRQHPEATDAQLAGMIAKQANITYSTVPASISVIQNQTARFALTRLFFSLGENEGLLRLFTGAIRGENAAYFRTRWVGMYLGLITLASVIHFASTGKPLPLDRFSPISKNKWGPLPVGYNTNFAAPTLPIRGRGDTEITLDLVGQMDTAFRLLDPKSFLSARVSVPVRAFESQRTGKDFFGAPIDTVGPGGVFSRIAQLAQDLFAPIGPGQAGLEVLRDNVEATEGLIQQGEARLGTTGIGIQASGVNLRAEQTPALLERIRGDVLAEMGITESYADIKANNLPLADQIDAAVEERIGGELELRRETTELRGQETPQSAGFQALEATRERQQVEQLADDAKLNSNQWPGDTWRDKFAQRQRDFFTSREQIKEDFQITFDDKEAPSKSINEAIDAYFDIDLDDVRYTRPDGTIDWDAFFDARDAALKPLSSADRRAVKTWLRKFDTPTTTEFRKAKDVVNRFFDTPKYQELSLREGEILDELVGERVEQVKRRELRDFGIELDTVTAIIIAAEQMGVSEKILNMALLFRERKVRDVFLTPERDEILFREQELLAKFYPDFLENQLSRAEEVTLGEPAFEAIAR